TTPRRRPASRCSTERRSPASAPPTTSMAGFSPRCNAPATTSSSAAPSCRNHAGSGWLCATCSPRPAPPCRGAMETIVVLLTRDLRVHDNPALHLAATAARGVVPLFVVDPRIRSSPNRRRFLAESLADLRTSLRARGSELVIRPGDPAAEAVRLARSVGAQRIFAAADASGYAARRQRRLADGCNAERLDLSIVDTITVVPPGRLRPAGGGEIGRASCRERVQIGVVAVAVQKQAEA